MEKISRNEALEVHRNFVRRGLFDAVPEPETYAIGAIVATRFSDAACRVIRVDGEKVMVTDGTLEATISVHDIRPCGEYMKAIVRTISHVIIVIPD